MNMQLSRVFTSVALFVLLSEPPGVLGYKKRALKTRQVFGVTRSVVELPSAPYKTDTQVEHKMDCVTECVNNVSCVAVELVDQTCGFFNEVPMMNKAFVPHSLVFVRTVEVFNVAEIGPDRYVYTFTEAQQACASLGARLASRSELQLMHDGGYQLCRCGWISEGDSIFPMQVVERRCGSIGLNPCDWSTKYSAWCSFA